MPRQIKRYGWKPSLPDFRDFHADTSGLAVLDEVDPRADMPRVFNQGRLGSCTANAVSAAKEYDDILDGLEQRRPARLFIYYCERMIEGVLWQGDTGAFGRDGFKALQTYGAPHEKDDHYVIADYQIPPTMEQWQKGLQHKLTKPYKAVPQDLTAFKQVLSNHQTIAFGFSVYESFESPEVASTGVVPLPQLGEQMLGGHEPLAVGYLKDMPEHCLCRNSWGLNWGLAGYFLMPWEYMLRSDLASDFRTIVRAS